MCVEFAFPSPMARNYGLWSKEDIVFLRITGWLLVLFLSGCGCGSIGRSAKKTEHAMQFPKTRLVEIAIRDAQRPDIDDYGAQVIPLVRLMPGDLVVPAVEVKQPKKGFMDRIVYVNQRQEPLLGAGKGSVLGLPDAPDVRAYLLLVKGLSSDTGWRVFEITPAKLGNGDRPTVTIANISALPRLDEHADAKEIRRLYERVAKEPREGEDPANRPRPSGERVSRPLHCAAGTMSEPLLPGSLGS